MKKICAFICCAVLLTAGVTMASAATPIRNLFITDYDATSVGVAWSPVGTNEPLYTVTCKAAGTDRVTERRTYRTYCTINYLSPGTTYEVTVSTGSGHTASTTFTMPSPGSFFGYNYQLLGTGVYQSSRYGTDYTAISALNGATLNGLLGDTDFSFMFRFKMSATSKYKNLDFQLTLRMPNGDVYTIPDVLEYPYSQTTVSEYYAFNSALKRIYNDYGEFPAGVYTLTAYIDNGVAAETTFTME
jgi:hypothetical protein